MVNLLKQNYFVGLDKLVKINFNEKVFDVQEDFKLLLFQNDDREDEYH